MATFVAFAMVIGGCSSSSPPGVDRAGPGRPGSLTVDDLGRPLGLDPGDVYFAWHIGDARRGATEQAYRIVVERQASPTDAVSATVVWDSGRVRSSAQAFVPYRGRPLAPDSTYGWRVQTWDGAGAAGPLSAPGHFETGLRDEDWKADWIRGSPQPGRPDQYTYLRTDRRLTASPIVRARAFVSADQQYELDVNGTRVGKGEAYSYPDQQYYETLDVTRALRPGADNGFGLLTYWDGATKGHPAGQPGAIVQISVVHADGSTQTIVTDGSWRVHPGAWRPGTQRDLEGDDVDYVENIDARAQPQGWDEPGFDATSWKRATVVGPAGTAPWTHLVSVRTRIVEQPVRAVSLAHLSSGAYVADFGEVYAAVPTVQFHHGVRGRMVKLLAGYLLDQPAGTVSRRGAQHTDMSYSYIERGGVEQFHPFDYLGFRYLEIDGAGEDLAAADVVALVRHTALPAVPAATFASSNPVIDRVFQLGAHSALDTAQEQFVDTPTREKGPWLWDGFNESVTDMDAFGEQNLTRKSLLEFASSQARYWPNGAVNKIYPTGLGPLDINEFTEIYPEWVWQYWLRTGDRTTLAAVYPAVARVAGYVARSIDPRTHLVTALPATNVYYDFPVVTRLNVLGVDDFRRAAELASALGRPAAEVARDRSRAASLTAAVNERLTRPDGVYVDGLAADGHQQVTAAQDTNASALVYGVAPADRRAAIGAYVAGLGMQAPPRTAAEVLEALALTGRVDDFVRRLTDASSPGWANILARGGTFTWEVWNPSDIIGDSMSHGWGADVLVEIQQELLGVRTTGAGSTAVRVAPPAGGLAWASGTVPTPAGTLAVSWRHSGPDGRTTTLDLTVPPGIEATVVLPGAPARTLGAGHWHLAHSS